MSELSRIKPLEEVQGPRSYLFYGTFGSGKTNLAIKHPGRKIVIDVDQKLKEDPNIDRSQIDIWEPGELLSDPAGIIIPYSPDPIKVQLGTFPSKEPQGYRRTVAVTNELITLSFKNELPYDVAICDSLTRVADHWVRLLMYTHKVTYMTKRLWGIYLAGLMDYVSGFLQLRCTRIIIAHDKRKTNENTGLDIIRPSIAGELGNNLGQYFSEVYHFKGRHRDGTYRIQTVKDDTAAARTTKKLDPEEIIDPVKIFA